MLLKSSKYKCMYESVCVCVCVCGRVLQLGWGQVNDTKHFLCIGAMLFLTVSLSLCVCVCVGVSIYTFFDKAKVDGNGVGNGGWLPK